MFVQATSMDADASMPADRADPSMSQEVPMDTGDAPVPDAPVPDAPVPDASVPDASVPDASVPPKRPVRRDVKGERIVVLEEQVATLSGRVEMLEKLVARVQMLEEHTGCSAEDV